MAEGINVRVSGALRQFVESQVGEDGLYESVSEYVRNLIRLDFERDELNRWKWLESQLRPALEAPASDFVDFDPDVILAKAFKIKN